MFDIGWGELVVIGIVALIAIGPKELPGVLRSLGHWMGKIRQMASEFQGQFQEAMREAEMSDLKKQVDDLGAAASDVGNFDPLAGAQKEFESALEGKPESKPAADPAPDAAAPDMIAPATTDAAAAPPAPTVDVQVALPEPLPPPSEQDFAPPEPMPPKQAEGGRPA